MCAHSLLPYSLYYITKTLAPSFNKAIVRTIWLADMCFLSLECHLSCNHFETKSLATQAMSSVFSTHKKM